MARIGGRPLKERTGAEAPALLLPRAESRAIADPVRGSAWITQQLRQAITEGNLRHGEKLPAERQLAEMFGASRTTVRSALNQLEEERLVTRRVGSGTFVNFQPRAPQDDVAELTSPLELIEVRLAVEPHMVRLAVLNSTARDLDRLTESLEEMERSSVDAESFTLLDEQFHLRIAECSRNPLMVSLYRQINDVRTHAQWNAMKDKVLTAERIAEYNRQHRGLVEAIQARDVESAVAIVTNHLHYARRQLLGASGAAGAGV
ncbi:MAG: FadR/GntR family transcriptional regulator [Pseudomonadota bacterium]